MLRPGLIAMLAALAVMAGAGTASAATPDATWPVGGPSMTVAQNVARSYWATDPCGGAVTIVWGDLDARTNAISSWTSYVVPAGQPALPNSDCVITFNRDMTFDWQKFCSVMVHEYGHLVGHDHSPNPADVMYAYYMGPVAPCTTAADPAGTTAAAAPAATTTSAPATSAASTAATAATTTTTHTTRVTTVKKKVAKTVKKKTATKKAKDAKKKTATKKAKDAKKKKATKKAKTSAKAHTAAVRTVRHSDGSMNAPSRMGLATDSLFLLPALLVLAAGAALRLRPSGTRR